MDAQTLIRQSEFFMAVVNAEVQAMDEKLAAMLCQRNPRVAEILRQKGYKVPQTGRSSNA